MGVFVRSSLWLNARSVMQTADDTASTLFCALSSAWIQYFYMATWLWTLCYAIDVRLVLKESEGHPVFYHFAAWTIPAVLTSFGLSLLYVPDANCHSMGSLSSAMVRILPNYCATYLPMAVVMVANPSLYLFSTRDVEKVISRSLSQYTRKERDIVDAIKLKFSLINVAFYICWLPNIINGILLWVLWFNLPEKVIVTLWYIMAVTNPLQALFNSLVYRRWSSSSERVYWPCREAYSVGPSISSDSTSWPKKGSPPGEETPLLQSEVSSARTSINGTSSDQ
ncbi:G-protein coupled receptor 143 isoform X2 [Anabrus simplex]